MLRPFRALEFRLAANATGAHKKNVTAGTAKNVATFTVATNPNNEAPSRCVAVSGPPQKYAYCSPVAPIGNKAWVSRDVRSVTSGGGAERDDCDCDELDDVAKMDCCRSSSNSRVNPYESCGGLPFVSRDACVSYIPSPKLPVLSSFREARSLKEPNPNPFDSPPTANRALEDSARCDAFAGARHLGRLRSTLFAAGAVTATVHGIVVIARSHRRSNLEERDAQCSNPKSLFQVKLGC